MFDSGNLDSQPAFNSMDIRWNTHLTFSTSLFEFSRQKVAGRLFSPVVVAKRRRRRGDKARDRGRRRRILTIRRGGRPSATQDARAYRLLQQTTGEKCGLIAR